MKNLLQSSKLLTIVAFLFAALLFYTAFKVYSLESEMKHQAERSDFRTRLLQNEIAGEKALLRPVVSAKEKLVVFPELDIALPYNDVTRTLQYSIYEFNNIVYFRVTSTALNDFSESRQMGCSELVRVNTNNGTPFSPWEEEAGTVQLASGKTLYITAARAFKSNEGSTEECATEVWQDVTPAQVATEFKKATSY